MQHGDRRLGASPRDAIDHHKETAGRRALTGRHRQSKPGADPFPGSARTVQLTPPLTGPATPQAGLAPPSVTLPNRPAHAGVTLWVVGSHGGAGESSIADLDESWRASGHAWPAPEHGKACACILVARTNVRGLLATQGALTQWAASRVAGVSTLLGLVLIADAPGRLPRALRDLAVHVSGGAPRTWELPWLEDWRLGEPDCLRAHRAVRRLVRDLHALTSAAASAENPRLASKETAATVDAAQTKGQEA